MSGGSYNYVYSHIYDAAEQVQRNHRDEQHVVAFAKLLIRCGDVMRDIEWADSCDTAWDAALDAKIRAIVTPAMELEQALEEAERVAMNLKGAIRRAEEGDVS